MPTVKVPIVGNVKRDYVIIVGLAAVGAAGYTYFRRGTGGDDLPLEPVDPGAGLIENTPQYQSSGAAGLYGSGDEEEDRNQPGRFILNSQWHQYVVEYLIQSEGVTRIAAETAVGKYLDHQTLTPSEQNLIRIATGAAGQPPQGSYTIKAEIPGATTPGAQTRPGAPRGKFMSSEQRRSYVTVRWDPPASGGTPSGYKVQLIEGKSTVRESWTLGAAARKVTSKPNLGRGKPYRFTIRAYNSAGDGPAWSGVVHTAR